MGDNLLKEIKQGFEQEAQIAKDRFIDDLIRRVNQFTQDWQGIIAKVGKIDEGQQKADKLNEVK